MKMLLPLSFLFFILTPRVHAEEAPTGPNPLFRFVAEVRILRELALYTVIEERCFRYMKPSDRNSCYNAVDQKVTLLDFDILVGQDKKTPVLLQKNNPGSFVFVAFKRDFLRLLSEKKTEAFLELVNREMTKFLVGEKAQTPNLWRLALSSYGSQYEASRAMAVLFQDTSPVKLHLAYLELSGARGNTEYFDPNRELLGRTIDTLNMVLDANGHNHQALFYPPEIASKLQGTIYHFYVPSYLSQALRKKGVPERFSFIAPLMMTLTYEFVTSASDYSYLFVDPKKIDATTRAGRWKIGDIFGGYNGVSFGLNRMEKLSSLEAVRNAFSVSTKTGVDLLTK